MWVFQCVVDPSFCPSVCGSVVQDLLQIKTKIFLEGLSTAPLHVDLERSKVKVKDAKVAKSRNRFWSIMSIAVFLQIGRFASRKTKMFLVGPPIVAQQIFLSLLYLPPPKEEVNAFARVRLIIFLRSVCLSVCLLARLLTYACMDAFLRRCKKLRYCDDNLPVIANLFDDADNQLFKRILANDKHILHHYMPQRTTANSQCLRPRKHYKHLIPKTRSLNGKDYIIRILYKDTY